MTINKINNDDDCIINIMSSGGSSLCIIGPIQKKSNHFPDNSRVTQLPDREPSIAASRQMSRWRILSVSVTALYSYTSEN